MTMPAEWWRAEAPQAMPILRKRIHDPELINALHLHAGLIIQSAARVLGNLHEAQDVAQDVAEKLLTSPPQSVRSWPALLKTMAVNAAIDRYRRRREVPEPDEPVFRDDPEVEFDRAQKATAFRQALCSLKQNDTTLISLYYLADLSQADIARHLHMSENGVSTALHRARKRLAAKIHPSLKTEELRGSTS